MDVLQEGGPLPGPRSGLLSNTQKWILRGDTHADKARNFIGKGHPGGEQEGKGTQEDCSATRLAVGFYGDGIRFQAVFSQSFWLRVLPGGTCLVKPRWMPVRRIPGSGRTCGVSFYLSRTLLVGGGLLVPCSLPGPPVINSSCKWWLWCLARVGGFSQCASPHRWRGLKCFEHLLCARYCARHFVYFN